MDLASRHTTQITKHFAIDTEATWMPDGQSLIFTSDRSGKPQLYQVAGRGGEPDADHASRANTTRLELPRWKGTSRYGAGQRKCVSYCGFGSNDGRDCGLAGQPG